MIFLFYSRLLIYASFLLLPKGDPEKFKACRRNIMNDYLHYQAEKDLGVKDFSFEITENGFIRYRRIFPNKKVEFFSLKIDKLRDIDYLGDEQNGWLLLKSDEESVIFQTYNDPDGDVDEMKNEILIPLKGIELSEINNLVSYFEGLKINS